MQAFLRPRLLIALLVLSAVGLAIGAAPRPQIAGAQPSRLPRVMVLGGGAPLSDNAVVQALQERELEVVVGEEAVAFTGAGNALRDIDVVVLLYTANFASPLTANGVAALTRFVEQGGALVTAGWAVWGSDLAPILPALYCDKNLALTTSYTRSSPHPLVNADLPPSFELSLANLAGSEACLEAREGATTLFASSNGGGRTGSAGLVAWNYGRGRVASFSTLLSATELLNSSYRALAQNTVGWLAAARDTTPPRIRSFTVSGAGGVLDAPIVRVELNATDSGGSRLGAYFIREFRYSGNPSNGWTEVASSGSWQPYSPPGASFDWTLDTSPGVHYLQAYVADRAGNVTPVPALSFVNYRPAQAALGLDEIHIYRIAPGAGTPTTITMNALSGNPDLYAFGPGVSEIRETDAASDVVNFTAQAGVYQVEVEGYVAGSYSLNVATGVALRDDSVAPPSLDRRPRIRVLSIEPPEPEPEPGTLPATEVDPGSAAMFDALYLPLLR
jgi:hypothetical protein